NEWSTGPGTRNFLRKSGLKQDHSCPLRRELRHEFVSLQPRVHSRLKVFVVGGAVRSREIVIKRQIRIDQNAFVPQHMRLNVVYDGVIRGNCDLSSAASHVLVRIDRPEQMFVAVKRTS